MSSLPRILASARPIDASPPLTLVKGANTR